MLTEQLIRAVKCNINGYYSSFDSNCTVSIVLQGFPLKAKAVEVIYIIYDRVMLIGNMNPVICL